MPKIMIIKNNRLFWNDDSALHIVGCGGPEGFLYQPSLALSRINKLIANGGNSLYTIAVRSHGGDGTSTENPFIGNTPASGVNDTVLTSWVPWFDLCTANNIVIYLMLYDDSTNAWGDAGSSTLSVNELAFIDAMIAKFGGYENIVWGYAEEADSTFNQARVTAGVSYFKANASQLVAIHQNPSNTPVEYGQDIFAVQTGDVGDSVASLDYDAINSSVTTARSNSASKHLGAWEIHPQHGGLGAEKTRRVTWAALMGGSSVMALIWDITNTDVLELNQARYAQLFFESAPLDGMTANNAVARNDAEYALSDSSSFILYGTSVTQLGISFLNAGDYTLTWLDTISGAKVTTNVALAAGLSVFTKPVRLGSDVALLINNSNAIDKATVSLTVTETATAVKDRPFIADDYHVCLRQIRSTRDYLLDDITPLLSANTTVNTINMLFQHLEVVHFRATAFSSITNKAVGQQAKARTEHSDPTYPFDATIAGLNTEMGDLRIVCGAVITQSGPNLSTIIADADRVNVLTGVNVLLSRINGI